MLLSWYEKNFLLVQMIYPCYRSFEQLKPIKKNWCNGEVSEFLADIIFWASLYPIIACGTVRTLQFLKARLDVVLVNTRQWLLFLYEECCLQC